VNVPEALYDLSTDPGETIDVAAEHPEIVKRLKDLGDTYREDLGDDLTNKEGKRRRKAAVVE